MISVKKILVTTDLSPESYSAFEYAAWIAAKEKSAITLLYCVDNLPSVAYHTVDLTFDKFRDELLKQEKKRFDRFSAPLLDLHKVKVQVVMLEGNAAQIIISYAKENAFDMIVMNTHGRTGLQHAVLGSIAEKVVRYAPCPVLTIRSKIATAVERKPKTKKGFSR